jgi:polar amino acid transport system substrate-binding protein
MLHHRHSLKAYALSLCLAAAGDAAAQPLCPKGGSIRFAHYEFGLLYSQGKGGIDDDVQKELARRSGCSFQVDVRPRARTWLDLESGQLDMAGSGVQTPSRARFAWFAHYVLEDNHVVLGPKVPAKVRSMADFVAHAGLEFGGVRSFSYSPFYDQQVAELVRLGRAYQVSDSLSLYRMFDLGRFDAFIGSQFLISHYFKQLGLPVPPRIEDWDPAPPTPAGLVLAKHRFSEAQARGWQALVREMLADGTMLRIVSRHLGPKEAPAAVFKPTQR